MAEKMFVGDFLRQVKQMEEACDQYGVKLYDIEDIAEAFGFVSVNNFNNAIKESRKAYRDIMKEKARIMIKEDENNNYSKIAEKLGISENTVGILLNKRYDDYSKRVRKMEDERQRAFNKFTQDISSSFPFGGNWRI